MNSRKSGVILSYALMIMEVLSTLLLTPLIIRTLGQSEYGVYKLSASIISYLLLLDLGVGNAIIRYISKFRASDDKINEQKFFAVAIVYYAIIAGVTILIGLVLIIFFPTMFSKGLSNEEIILGQKLLMITMINSAITLGTAAFSNIIIGYERFAFSKLSSIVQIVVRMLCTWIVLLIGFGSLGVVSVNLILTIILKSVHIIYVLFKIKLKPLFKNINISFVKDIATYSSFVLLQMVATQINAFADQILIGAFVSSSATIIAIYGVGSQIVQYFQSIGSSFNGVLMPGVVKLVEYGVDGKILCNEMVRIGRIIFSFLVIIFSVFLVFGRQFIILWAGSNNSEAYNVAIILIAAHIFILTENIGNQILWAKGEHKEQSILKIIIVLLNIGLTILLIKWNPLIGATIGTFISLLLGDIVVMNIIFKKKIHISLSEYYKNLMKGILPCSVITILGGYLFSLAHLDGWFGFAINVIVMCLIYLLLMIFFGFNSYEKSLICGIARKILKIRNNGGK